MANTKLRIVAQDSWDEYTNSIAVRFGITTQPAHLYGEHTPRWSRWLPDNSVVYDWDNDLLVQFLTELPVAVELYRSRQSGSLIIHTYDAS